MLDETIATGLKAPAERYRGLFSNAKIPMLLIDPADGAIVEANEAACNYYGYTEEQLSSKYISDINIFSAEQVQEEMERANSERRHHFYFRHRLASGEVRDVEVHSGPLVINGRQLLYSVIHDITERREAEHKLQESEARFRHIMEHAPLGIAITDSEGRFLQVNQALCQIAGLQQDQLEGKSIIDITYPDDSTVSARYKQELLDGSSSTVKYEKRYLRPDGEPVWVQVSVSLERDWSGQPLYFIHLVEDISKRKAVEQRISFLAHHDRLTQLPNRDLFLDRFSRAIGRARRQNKLMALFFMDLDGFKEINDEHGHEAGDTVLRIVAQRMLACVRNVDTVARLGGDEFAAIFEEIEDPESVAPIAEKIIEQLSAPIVMQGQCECVVGVSIGIAIYPENGAEIDRLLSAADDAMYVSKRRGKSTYTYARGKAHGHAGSRPWIVLDEERLLGEPEIDHQHLELVRMLNELNDAVRNDDSPEEVARLFDAMVSYAELHFAVEEQLMDKYDYPERSVHKSEHKRLIEEAAFLKEKLARGGELLVLQSLKDWLLAHTYHVDKPFIDYLHRHGVNSR